MIAPVDDLDSLLARLRETTGLATDGCHHDRIVNTVRQLHRAAGTPDHRAYADLLAADETARDCLIDRLTVGETYFFREPAHLSLLRDTIAPSARTAAHGGLRVWSAGCASGEEAYSVAITLDEAGVLDDSQIVGTDLSAHALERARAATYSPWSLRRCDEGQRRRWFREERGRFHLDPRYRDVVRWERRGLLDGPPPGSFDVVLCRNVLIYLTPSAVRAATDTLHDSLADGGWLLLGASDPPLEHPGLHRTVDRAGAVYRRAAPRREREPPGIARAAIPARRQRRTVRRAASVSRSVPDRRTDRLAAEIEVSDDAERRYAAAAAHLEAGRVDDAAREVVAALYLDPTMVVGHLLLAHCGDIVGDDGRADRDRRNALALLRRMPADAVVPLSDGEQAGDLVTVLVEQLRRSARVQRT